MTTVTYRIPGGMMDFRSTVRYPEAFIASLHERHGYVEVMDQTEVPTTLPSEMTG